MDSLLEDSFRIFGFLSMSRQNFKCLEQFLVERIGVFKQMEQFLGPSWVVESIEEHSCDFSGESWLGLADEREQLLADDGRMKITMIVLQKCERQWF